MCYLASFCRGESFFRQMISCRSSAAAVARRERLRREVCMQQSLETGGLGCVCFRV